MLRQVLLTLRSGVFYLGYVMITVVLSTGFILLFPLLKSVADIALRQPGADPYSDGLN